MIRRCHSLVWCTNVRDSFVQEAVRGHRLEYCARPPRKPPVQTLRGEKRRLIQEEVNSLLVKGAIEPVRDQSRGFYSNLFLVKKSDSGLGPMINLGGLNCYIKKRTFRMSTIKDVSQSICRGDWASTIDLKDAYLQSKGSQKVPAFLVGGKELPVPSPPPFRLSSAPRTFTRSTLLLIRLIAYLDDFLCWLAAGRSCSDIPT